MEFSFRIIPALAIAQVYVKKTLILNIFLWTFQYLLIKEVDYQDWEDTVEFSSIYTGDIMEYNCPQVVEF